MPSLPVLSFAETGRITEGIHAIIRDSSKTVLKIFVLIFFIFLLFCIETCCPEILSDLLTNLAQSSDCFNSEVSVKNKTDELLRIQAIDKVFYAYA